MARGKAKTPEQEQLRRQKISEARRKRKEMLGGSLNTEAARQRMSEAARQRRWTPEQRKKIVSKKKGVKPKNFDGFLAKAHAIPRPTGEKSYRWKGDAVGYSGLHQWIKKQLGTPSLCAECGTTQAKRYEWANISGEYHRDVNDFRRLCVSCHRKESFERGESVAWNKGMSVCSNTGRTHFKPGIVPHNKHINPKACAQCGVVFNPRLERVKYCSRPCYWRSMRNEIKET